MSWLIIIVIFWGLLDAIIMQKKKAQVPDTSDHQQSKQQPNEVEKLKALKEAFELGLITEEEYSKKKADLLESF